MKYLNIQKRKKKKGQRSGSSNLVDLSNPALMNYIKSLEKIPPISHKESKKLAKSKNYNKLIEGNLRLAFKLAESFSSSKEEFPSLLSAANEGLSKAAYAYNPDKKTKFSTFSRFLIQKEIYEQKKTNHIVKPSSMHYTNLKKVEEFLSNKEFTPNKEYIEKKLDITYTNHNEEYIEDNEQRVFIQEAPELSLYEDIMSRLTPLQKEIFMYKFHKNYSFEEMSKNLNMESEYIEGIFNDTIKKLKDFYK